MYTVLYTRFEADFVFVLILVYDYKHFTGVSSEYPKDEYIRKKTEATVSILHLFRNVNVTFWKKVIRMYNKVYKLGSNLLA